MLTVELFVTALFVGIFIVFSLFMLMRMAIAFVIWLMGLGDD